MDTAMSGLGSHRPSRPRVSGRIAADPAASERERPETGAAALDIPSTGSLASERIRRGVNVVLAILALLVALPIMLVIALLIRLTSRGPVIYTQTRVGLDRRWNRLNDDNHRRTSDIGGKPFEIYKFRTMRVDAELHSGAVWAQEHDPRVTRIGRVLRQYRLDELPQFINVLRGEMNIVGPRPERPQIFAQLRESVEDYPLRQRAKPGITGLAQINNKYDACLDDVRRKVDFDLRYIKRQSVSEDLKIMLKTVPVILFRRGGW